MKNLISVLVAFAFAGVLPAQPASTGAGSPQPAASGTSSGGMWAPGELAALEHFLNLSDAELDQVQAAIARLRALTPAQRAALRNEIVAFRQLPEPQRQQLRQGWGWMPPEIQNGWREMMQQATPERRAEIQAQMQSLPPEEKTAFRKKLVEEFLKAKSTKP